MAEPDKRDLYETDYYAWVNEQSALLRSGQLQSLDIKNVLEEVEEMGRKVRRELESRLTVLLLHLLKWQFQPDIRGASWEIAIKRQRHDICELINENPSLKPIVTETVSSAYKDAVYYAHIERASPKRISPPAASGRLITLWMKSFGLSAFRGELVGRQKI